MGRLYIYRSMKTLKINHSWICRYTVRPMGIRWKGLGLEGVGVGRGWRFSSRIHVLSCSFMDSLKFMSLGLFLFSFQSLKIMRGLLVLDLPNKKVFTQIFHQNQSLPNVHPIQNFRRSTSFNFFPKSSILPKNGPRKISPEYQKTSKTGVKT